MLSISTCLKFCRLVNSLQFTIQSRLATTLRKKPLENTLENAGNSDNFFNQQFSIFQSHLVPIDEYLITAMPAFFPYVKSYQ